MDQLLQTSQRRKLKRVGLLVGLALIAAAVLTIARSGSIASQAWQHLSHASPILFAALLGCIALITLCTTLSMLILTNRTRPPIRVEFREMLALICASTLGNFIPLQPGLIGRIAFHHQVHGIAVPYSVLIAIQSTALTGFAALWIGAGLAITHATQLSWIAAILSPMLLVPFLRNPTAREFAAAFFIRIFETCVWALRIHISFHLIGQDIDASAALALACIANAANTIPFVGNGLGIREWSVGFLAPLIAGVPLVDALAAELVGRIAEIIFFIPAGLAAWPMLHKRLRVHRTLQSGEVIDSVSLL
ncbi:MAG: hypothetical protein EXS12_05025 [Phycisphaerales bacterium]|nr:hypothetical protein [Phycisphaerales bacterium]